MGYLRGLIYNNGDGQTQADAKCINRTEIIASGKYMSPSDIATNTNSLGSIGAFLPLHFQKIGDFETATGEKIDDALKPNAHLWKSRKSVARLFSEMDAARASS